jgi:hypothetical protein
VADIVEVNIPPYPFDIVVDQGGCVSLPLKRIRELFEKFRSARRVVG